MSPHAKKLVAQALEAEIKVACLQRKPRIPKEEVVAARQGAIIAQGQLRRYIDKLETELERRQ